MESYSKVSEPLTPEQYLERLPPKVRARLERKLKNEERLLWAEWTGISTVADLYYWFKLAAAGFLKGLMWTGLICLALLVAGFVTKINLLVGFGLFLIASVVVLMTALWLAARGTVYALSDQRAMTVSPVNFTSCSEIDPAWLTIVEYAPDLTGFILGQESYKSVDGEEHDPNFEIYARTGAAHLKELLLNNFSSPGQRGAIWPKPK